MKSLTNHIATLFHLSPQDAELFLSQFSQTVLKKNDVFVAEGQVCNKVGLIEHGLMKCVYNKEGEEVVFEFAHEGNFISDYYSFVTNTPSEKEIRCLEDTTLYVITKEKLQTLAIVHPFIESLSRTMNERLFLQLHDRLKSMLLDDAQQRYQQLLVQRRDLAQRIPQYLIASYLNVTPETISRIRKKMSI
ncbi:MULTISPECIES: Crp/Fnr family transcriptional regulator [Niastella]|uniref:Crp/Fnr family transcriptional regulator n=1 Tax=Niastella soli TaxID=2821487 RepID=A0ABS3YZX9_9BACT|nr:Crp/Fnr family transcriptional regulator [Niastella soli]MBO9203480.1 Crp/Fnr family transcriptional regulator [Niastella soli]